MGIKYGKINYPLDGIENLTNVGSNECTNFRVSNHSILK